MVRNTELTTGPGIPLRPSEPGLPGDPWGPTGPVFPWGPSKPDSPFHTKTGCPQAIWFLLIYWLLDIVGVLSKQKICICWVHYLGSLLSLSSLRSCCSRGALLKKKNRWQRLILNWIQKKTFYHFDIDKILQRWGQDSTGQNLLSFLVVRRDQTLQ